MQQMDEFHQLLSQRLCREYGTDFVMTGELIELDYYLNSDAALSSPDSSYEHLVGLYITELISRP